MDIVISLSRLIIGITIILQVIYAQRSCPWDDPDLEKWSEASTWPNKRVPQENEAVFIPADKKVLLDTPIPRLKSLIIAGTLVWGNVEGIRMETSYTLVKGQFHIGSEECNFEKKADIFLYGKSNSWIKYGTYGTKFVGADPGSTLEIHGKAKKSWTKLIATIKKPSCGVVYDSLGKLFPQKFSGGVHVVVWNLNGSLYYHEAFNTAWKKRYVDSFVSKMNDPDLEGKVVAIAVKRDLGDDRTSLEPLYQAIEKLGGQTIRDVETFEPYAFVAVVGQPETARDEHVKRIPGPNLVHARTSITVKASKLVFEVESVTAYSGGKHYTRFRVLPKSRDSTLLSVLDDVTSWQPGDQVVVTSTDFDWKQAEVKTIVPCSDCASNQIRVEGEFKYSHFGQVTYGVDERAEVGLLSRNIRIEGEVQDTCHANDQRGRYLCGRFGKDTFGGHVKINLGAFARIEGTELYHLGQQYEKGHYPLHFHMCDKVPGQYFKNNSIRDSFSRCITIHGTDNATISDNVCLNHLGHGIFLEDSAERWNTIHRNLIIGATHGTLIASDRRRQDCKRRNECDLLSSYWITRPENFLTDNVAAGGDGHGFVFAFADEPLGYSYEREIERGSIVSRSAQYAKVALFSGNVMHSYVGTGLWFDSRISNGETIKGKTLEPDRVIKVNSYYDPRDPPNKYGRRTETILSGMTIYKNKDFDVWMRCGNIVISNSSFADSTASVMAAHSTSETSCDIRHSIFIGQTDNTGEPFVYTNNSAVYNHLPKEERPTHHFHRSLSHNESPDIMQRGILMYQGPMYVDNCYFDRFFNWYFNDSFVDAWGFRPVRPAAAIGFRRSNHYPMVPRNGVRNLKFGYCDGEHNCFRVANGNSSTQHWLIYDGNALTTFRDYDGSLTGTANTQIVRDRPFYTGPECLSKPAWDMAVCPYKYAQLIIHGYGGVLDNHLRESWPVQLSRDDHPQDVISIEGTRKLKYPIRVHTSYTIRFNASLGDAPTSVQIKIKNGLETNEIIRLAICFPKSTTEFDMRISPWVNKRLTPFKVYSLAELDADDTMRAYFWDRRNGYLIFKISSNESFTNWDQETPGDVNRGVTIKRLNGRNKPATCKYHLPPYSNPHVPQPARVKEAPCKGPDSPEGLGALVVEGHPGLSVPDETEADCPNQVDR